ncbi:hypothetical protein CFP65_7648 [Kitasatospora sp. MMS16-BH015]|nr:hypothetical protein CFP65_7648 [Kitasatospora sp. MMS16-BH015]
MGPDAQHGSQHSRCCPGKLNARVPVARPSAFRRRGRVWRVDGDAAGSFNGLRAPRAPDRAATVPPSPAAEYRSQARVAGRAEPCRPRRSAGVRGSGPARETHLMSPTSPANSGLLVSAGRRRCTGESHSSLLTLASTGADTSSIPGAQARQMELEAGVYRAVCKIGGLSAHPNGIRQVRPVPGRLDIRLLNEPYVVRYRAEHLLPTRSGDHDDHPLDQVTGVPGLRDPGRAPCPRPGPAHPARRRVALHHCGPRPVRRRRGLLGASRAGRGGPVPGVDVAAPARAPVWRGLRDASEG